MPVLSLATLVAGEKGENGGDVAVVPSDATDLGATWIMNTQSDIANGSQFSATLEFSTYIVDTPISDVAAHKTNNLLESKMSQKFG